MGTKVPKSVGDYPSFGVDLGVCCTSCGRIVVFRASEVEAYLKMRGLRTSLPVETSIFKCRCGSRRVNTIGVPIDKRPPPHTVFGQTLNPLYVMRPGRKLPPA